MLQNNCENNHITKKQKKCINMGNHLSLEIPFPLEFKSLMRSFLFPFMWLRRLHGTLTGSDTYILRDWASYLKEKDQILIAG